jgi:pimeloyl-ACP methyl ester carboxylesterase
MTERQPHQRTRLQDFVALYGTRLEVAHIPGPADQAPLVFLHEGLGSVAMWPQRGRDWPAELCAASGRAGWVYSRRGYGRSDPIPDVRGPSRTEGRWSAGRHQPDYMHREAWEVLPALLHQLGVQQPVLVGHSDGGTIALLHASRHPVAACVAIAPHVMIEPVALSAIAQAREQYLGGGLRERLARYHADVDNAFWQWNDVWLSEGFRRFDIRAECASITAPLLALQGEDDAYGTLEQLAQIAQAAPQTRTLALPDCGHSPHRDQPDALTEAVQAFLRDLG